MGFWSVRNVLQWPYDQCSANSHWVVFGFTNSRLLYRGKDKDCCEGLTRKLTHSVFDFTLLKYESIYESICRLQINTLTFLAHYINCSKNSFMCNV